MTAGGSVTPDVAVGARFRVAVVGELATITLDRPERLNAQTPLTWTELARVGTALPGTVRVVVVRGAGRAFSAGLDRALVAPADGTPGLLAQLASSTPADADEAIAGYQRGFGWLTRPDLVSIAAVQGHAIGAGFQLALACDLRVVADDAQFIMAEVGLGLVPDLGGTKRLVELIGYSRAAELCLTTRRVDAAEAWHLGLASSVVAPARLDDAVADLVASLLGRPRGAVIEAKALLLAAAGRSQAEQEGAEREAQYRRVRELAGLDTEA